MSERNASADSISAAYVRASRLGNCLNLQQTRAVAGESTLRGARPRKTALPAPGVWTGGTKEVGTHMWDPYRPGRFTTIVSRDMVAFNEPKAMTFYLLYPILTIQYQIL